MADHDASVTSLLQRACDAAAGGAERSADALALLKRAAQAADALGVLSANDRLAEISTPSLRALFLPSFQAHVVSEQRLPPGDDRMRRREAQVEESRGAAQLFFRMARRYGVWPPPVDRVLRGAASEAPAERRMLKIQRLKLEKQVVAQLDAARQALRAKRKCTTTPPADVFLDLAVMPAPQGGDEADDDDDDDDGGAGAAVSDTLDVHQPTTLRSYLLLLLVLHALRMAALEESATQELELLRQRPAEPARPAAPPADEAWRLDASWTTAQGPLLSDSGKPLRPFVITPSGARRAQLQSEVFRPSHRLPTMSIDEYLEEERRRGNIIGPNDKSEATPREQRAELAEMDGTRAADDAEEEARQEALYWDEYKEHHRRGEGNTMNRG